MRILHVNKFLHRRGGAEAYMEDVADRQRAAGHRIAFFAMDHPDNSPSEFGRHFPSRVELNPPPRSLHGRAAAVGRMLHSPSARRGIEAVLEEFRPDVVHLHNIYHQLSPSILRPLERRGVAAVMTLHDYKLACPTYRLLDHGEVCTACVGRRFHNAVLRRCESGSRGASAVVALELSLHTLFGAYRPVGVFVCPSEFMARTMRAAGVFPDRLRTLRHFANTDGVAVRQGPGEAVVFAGRLSAEKGVDVLVEAVAARPGALLEVLGDGPDRAALEALAAARAPGRIRFHGSVPKARVEEMVRAARAVAVPSRWYENQPMIVLEAFACGVPVVATTLGGLPELVEPGLDGLLVPAADVPALTGALGALLDDPARAVRMGLAARRKAEQHFSPAAHLAGLDRLYAEAARGVRAPRRSTRASGPISAGRPADATAER
ncbi:MAG TPA: glycosyltransferase [Candidatus Dormibacteraeota bacterium]